MKALTATARLGLGLLIPLLSHPSQAQGPGGRGETQATGLADRMMEFDRDKDGSLTKDEITDVRLTRLFDQADANKDGVVTRAELNALEAKDSALGSQGPGGPGGPGGFRMGQRPGEVLSAQARQGLDLTDAQVKQLDDLQKEVDVKLAKILTTSQKKQLDGMRRRGPGGPGGLGRPGGPPPGGFGGPGGPPTRPPARRLRGKPTTAAAVRPLSSKRGKGPLPRYNGGEEGPNIARSHGLRSFHSTIPLILRKTDVPSASAFSISCGRTSWAPPILQKIEREATTSTSAPVASIFPISPKIPKRP